MAVEVGDMVLEVRETATVKVGGTAVGVGVMVVVGGRGVKVGGMGAAKGVSVPFPP
jgi:hypothetical protein